MTMDCSAGLNEDMLFPSSPARVAVDKECAERIDELIILFQKENRIYCIFLPFLFFSFGLVCGTLFPHLLPSVYAKFLTIYRMAVAWLARIYLILTAKQSVGELSDLSIERRRSIASRRNSTKKVLLESSYGTPHTASYGQNIRRLSLVSESCHGLIEARGVELTIVTVDPTVCRMLGWTVDAGRSLPTTVHDLLPPELRDLHCRLILQARHSTITTAIIIA
jgi:hypothetical protein